MGSIGITIDDTTKCFINELNLYSNHRFLTFDPLRGGLVGAGRTGEDISVDCLKTESIALLCGSIVNVSMTTSHTELNSQSESLI